MVPFPLTSNTETARNNVLLAHRETAPPDIVSLRKEHLPNNWSEAQKAKEVQVPVWLLNIIYKCLQKDPKERYANGVKLLEAIREHSLSPVIGQTYVSTDRIQFLEKENERLLQENRKLKEQFQTQNTRPYTSNTQPFVTTPVKRRPFGVKTILPGIIGLGLLLFLISLISRENAAPMSSAATPVTTSSDRSRTSVSQPASAAIENQLREASRLLDEGRLVDALELYDYLSDHYCFDVFE